MAARGTRAAADAGVTVVDAPDASVRSVHAAVDAGGGSDELAEYSRRLAEQARAQAPGAAAKKDKALPDPLAVYERADVLRVLGLSDEPTLQLRAVRGLVASTSIVVLSFQRRPSLQDLDVRVFVLSEQGGQLVRHAAGAIHMPAGSCADRDAAPGSSHRELALEDRAYAIGSDRAAFAVRFECSISEPSSAGEEVHVLLLQNDGDVIKQIFDFTASRAILDRVSRIETSDERSLKILREHHDGYFDLGIHHVRARRLVPLDAESQRDVEVQVRDEVYRWNGTEYSLLLRRN